MSIRLFCTIVRCYFNFECGIKRNFDAELICSKYSNKNKNKAQLFPHCHLLIKCNKYYTPRQVKYYLKNACRGKLLGLNFYCVKVESARDVNRLKHYINKIN